jgi:hypothetical protein
LLGPYRAHHRVESWERTIGVGAAGSLGGRQASERAVGSGRTRVGGCWRRKWRDGPRAAACASIASWGVLQVAGCECSEWPRRQQQQQQKSGLQDVQDDQNGCCERRVVKLMVGGANLTVRTRRWVGPYKSRGCGARRRGFFLPSDPDWGRGKISRGGSRN